MKNTIIIQFAKILLLMLISCNKINESGETYHVTEIPNLLSASTTQGRTTTPTKNHTSSLINTPGIIVPKQPITSQNALKLSQIKLIGNQYEELPRGFPIKLSPNFDVYAITENSKYLDEPLTFTIRKVENEEIIFKIIGDIGKRFRAIFSPNGQYFAVGNDQGIISVWDVYSGERVLHGDLKLSKSPYGGGINYLAFSPDGNILITDAFGSRWFALWNIKMGRIGPSYYCYKGHACEPIKFSPDGKFIIISAEYVSILDGKTGSYIRKFTDSKWVITEFAFSPKGDLVSIIDRSLTVSIYEFPIANKTTILSLDKELIKEYQINSVIDMGTSMSFSPDGKILAGGFNQGYFVLWNIETGQKIFNYRNPDYAIYQNKGKYSDIYGIYGIMFSGDGKTLATESSDNTITFWGIQ
jgi:WD40 repeat protein